MRASNAFSERVSRRRDREQGYPSTHLGSPGRPPHFSVAAKLKSHRESHAPEMRTDPAGVRAQAEPAEGRDRALGASAHSARRLGNGRSRRGEGK